MSVVTESVRFGEHCGYLALPQHAGQPVPAVLLIHDSLGLDDHVEDVARRLAAAGYAALAPDLYSVGDERPAALSRERIDAAVRFLAAHPEFLGAGETAREAALAALPALEGEHIAETLAQIFAFGAAQRRDHHVDALRAAVDYLRAGRPETRGQKVASLGEGLSALLACEEPDLAACVVFYGLTPPPEKLARIRCPVIAFYGSQDTAVNSGIAAFAQAMRAAGLEFESHIYEGAGHGFFNDTRPGYYDVQASRDAFARLLSFLARTLQVNGVRSPA